MLTFNKLLMHGLPMSRVLASEQLGSLNSFLVLWVHHIIVSSLIGSNLVVLVLITIPDFVQMFK